MWTGLQADYDLRLARRARLKAIEKRVKPLPRAA
jgi:plasmid maintenance system antidote protein VapI